MGTKQIIMYTFDYSHWVALPFLFFRDPKPVMHRHLGTAFVCLFGVGYGMLLQDNKLSFSRKIYKERHCDNIYIYIYI